MKRFVALAAALCIILSVSAAGEYSDKDKISPSAAEAVELMYDLDIMRGDGINFRPNANITREEMFRVVYSLTSVGGRMTEAEQGYWSAVMEEHSSNVPDADKIASWAYPYAGYCLEKGYFVGSSDGSLRPKSEIGAVKKEISLPEQIDAPIEKGSAVGSVIYKVGDNEIGRVDIVAEESVEKLDFGSMLLMLLRKCACIL